MFHIFSFMVEREPIARSAPVRRRHTDADDGLDIVFQFRYRPFEVDVGVFCAHDAVERAQKWRIREKIGRENFFKFARRSLLLLNFYGFGSVVLIRLFPSAESYLDDD